MLLDEEEDCVAVLGSVEGEGDAVVERALLAKMQRRAMTAGSWQTSRSRDARVAVEKSAPLKLVPRRMDNAATASLRQDAQR